MMNVQYLLTQARKINPVVDLRVSRRHLSAYTLGDLLLRIYVGYNHYWIMSPALVAPVKTDNDDLVLRILRRTLDTPAFYVDPEDVVCEICEALAHFGVKAEMCGDKGVVHLHDKDCQWQADEDYLFKDGCRFPSIFRPAWAVPDALSDMTGWPEHKAELLVDDFAAEQLVSIGIER